MTSKDDAALSSRSAIVNKEFLQKILFDDHSRPSATVTNYSIKRSENENGFASDMYFIDVEYIQSGGAEDTKTASLVMKCPPTGSEYAKFYCQTSAFLREITAFSQIFPKMYSLLESKSFGSFEPFSPTFYYSQLIPHPMLIMEYLKSYRIPSQHKGLDLNICVKVLHIMARIHAASAVLYEKDPQIMEVFKNAFYFENSFAIQNWEKSFVTLARDIATEVEKWPDFGTEVSRKLHKFTDTLMERQDDLMKPNHNGFNAFSHTDLWTNNLLFQYSAVDGSVEHIRIIDYQNAHFTSPVIDLHFFLTACPSYDIRLKYDDFLLEEYHKELSRILNLLEFKGNCPSLSELKEEFYKKLGVSLFVALTDLQVFLAETRVELDAITDTESKSAKLCESKLYKQMMYKLLPFFLSNGIV